MALIIQHPQSRAEGNTSLRVSLKLVLRLSHKGLAGYAMLTDAQDAGHAVRTGAPNAYPAVAVGFVTRMDVPMAVNPIRTALFNAEHVRPMAAPAAIPAGVVGRATRTDVPMRERAVPTDVPRSLSEKKAMVPMFPSEVPSLNRLREPGGPRRERQNRYRTPIGN